MSSEAVRQEVEGIRWFHTIDLGNGIVTPGADDSPSKLAGIALPEDLTGKSLLDIGAWDGFFSFEAERRGAERVVAVDSYSWSGQGWGTKRGFDLARRVLSSRVEDVECEVLDLSPDTLGTFDVVLFLGVLYHLRHPLLALERVAAVTRERLILETHVDLIGFSRPAAAFYPEDELNGDFSNWWAPNPAGVIGLLKAAGFSRIEIVRHPASATRRLCRAVVQRVRDRAPFWAELRRDRIAVHAWK